MLQFDENGKLIVPESIQKDLDDQKEAKEMGLTVTQLRKLKDQTEKRHKRNLHVQEVLQEMEKHAQRPNQKVSDEEVANFHNRGFSDYEIAKIFRCNPTSVWMHRAKQSLVANFPAPYGKENLTADELHERYRQRIEGNYSVPAIAPFATEVTA